MNKDYFDELYKKGIEASRIGQERRKNRPIVDPILKAIPEEVLKACRPKTEGKRYAISHKGGWDVYESDGTYVDTFDTKGAAWNALYEG